jgi:hypothetical protein
LFDELDKTFEYLLNFIEETVPDWVQADTPAVADQVLNRLPSLLDGRSFQDQLKTSGPSS